MLLLFNHLLLHCGVRPLTDDRTVEEFEPSRPFTFGREPQWEQAYIESFHDKLRGECLNREIFGSLLEAKIIVKPWRMEYNNWRPHSSLRYRTRTEFY